MRLSRLLAVSVACLTLAGWLVMRDSGTPGESSDDAGMHATPATTDALSGPSDAEKQRASSTYAGDPPESELRAPEDVGARQDSSTLMVLLEGGSPAAQAEASWVPRDAADLVRAGFNSQATRDELRGRSIEAHADEDGRLRLPAQLLDDANGSVLWITCPGASARCFRLGPRERPSDLENPVHLARAPTYDTRVVKDGDQSASHARVLAVRALPRDPPASAESTGLEDARFLFREVIADEDGRAIVPDLGGRARLVAHCEGYLSAPWLGDTPAQPRLELRRTFTLLGTVLPADGLDDVDELTVTVGAHVGQQYVALARVPVDARGSYGPIDLPALDRFEGTAELAGGAFVPESSRLVDVAYGETRRMDFHPRRGVPLPVLVVDARDAPIADAEVELAWQAGEHWQRSSARTDAQGLALFRGGPLGSIWIEARARGHVLRRENTVVEARWSEPYRIRLQPGGTIRGAVHHRGAPVSDFTVTYWRGGPGDRAWSDFSSRRDGTFEIDGVPFGDLSLFAAAPGAGRSSLVRARVGEGVVPAVALEMEGCVRASGTIVDAITRDGFAGAVVQPFLAHERWALDAFGSPETSDAAGRFSIPCLAQGDASLDVRASGYASVRHAVRAVRAGANESEVLELGTIGLERGSSLELTLLLPSSDSATLWMGGVSGIEHREPTPFGADGVLRIEGLRPGEWTWSVLDPVGGARYGQVRIEPLRPAQVVVRADVDRDTEIVLVERANAPLQDPAYVYVSSLGTVPDGESPITAMWVPPSRRIACRLAPGVVYDLVVLDASGRYVGSLRAPASSEPARSLRIRVGEPDARVRVVDRRGEPLAGVEVHIDAGTGHAARRTETDAQGLASVGPWPHPTGNVRLARADLGAGYLRGVRLEGSEPARIEFAPDAPLEVRCHDGDTPIEGAHVLLLAPLAVDHVLASLTTGPDGAVRFAAVMPGDYSLRIVHASTWTTRMDVSVPAGGTAIEVDTRRRGSLVFECLRHGGPASDVAIQLRALDLGVDADIWAAQGLVLARPESGRSGTDGRLRYDGLPRGRYEWKTATVDGKALRGTVDVWSGSIEQVVVDLGP